jgi:Insect cuticle protein
MYALIYYFPDFLHSTLLQYPPKYEYNYFVANRQNQAAQGHKEIRNGDNTAGNYFVNLPKGESKTTVNYIADLWGYYPITR